MPSKHTPIGLILDFDSTASTVRIGFPAGSTQLSVIVSASVNGTNCLTFHTATITNRLTRRIARADSKKGTFWRGQTSNSQRIERTRQIGLC